MSAQMVTALRNRANELETEADLMEEVSRQRIVNLDTGLVRDRTWMRFLAFEYRALADQAEGHGDTAVSESMRGTWVDVDAPAG